MTGHRTYTSPTPIVLLRLGYQKTPEKKGHRRFLNLKPEWRRYA